MGFAEMIVARAINVIDGSMHACMRRRVSNGFDPWLVHARAPMRI
jgi:hypothetical protein